MATDRMRVNIYLPDDVAEKLRGLAKLYGKSLSGAASMAISSGVDVLTLIKNPAFVEIMESYIEKEKSNDLETNRGQGPK